MILICLLKIKRNPLPLLTKAFFKQTFQLIIGIWMNNITIRWNFSQIIENRMSSIEQISTGG